MAYRLIVKRPGYINVQSAKNLAEARQIAAETIQQQPASLVSILYSRGRSGADRLIEQHGNMAEDEDQ